MTTAAQAPGAFLSFAQRIASHAAERPRAIAFRVDDRTLDWATLDARMRSVATSLVRAGVRPGDHVAVLGAASLPYLECLFGTIAARACVVPLPVSASVDTLQALLADCGARVLFLDEDASDEVVALAGRLAQGGLQVVPLGAGGADGPAYAAWRDGGRGTEPLPAAHPDDPFNIIYSSGTTGLPKGIVHTHGMRSAQAGRKGFFTPEARTLLSTPMYSNTTLMPLLGTLTQGGTVLLMRKFDAGRWLALAAAERATHTMLVPTQYKRLLAHAAFAATDLSALQLSQCTGAPLDVDTKSDLLRRWPGRFLEVYGMTEGGPSCFLDAREHPDKLATVGRPGHGAEIFLLDEAGRPLPPGPGSVGEVVGRSPFMMAGYHRRPEATAELRWLDADGRVFHRSGDIGRFDADGFLTLLDRIKDVIISGGHNIYAADLEAVLARHPQVQDCAVIGVPSREWGETPLALVVPRSGATLDPAALRDWANAQVGKTQRLSAVELRGELPRSALGKLSKKDLRAAYWTTPQPSRTTP